nr:hypothetical protein [Desulfobacula sp.]
MIPFKPPQNAVIIEPLHGPAQKRLAAATPVIEFVGKHGFVCRAVRVKDQERWYEVTAEQTPNRQAVYLAVMDQATDRALTFRPKGVQTWTDTIKLQSGQRKKIEFHPHADTNTKLNLIIWQI